MIASRQDDVGSVEALCTVGELSVSGSSTCASFVVLLRMCPAFISRSISRNSHLSNASMFSLPGLILAMFLSAACSSYSQEWADK